VWRVPSFALVWPARFGSATSEQFASRSAKTVAGAALCIGMVNTNPSNQLLREGWWRLVLAALAI
jgi:hypothetical protein